MIFSKLFENHLTIIRTKVNCEPQNNFKILSNMLIDFKVVDVLPSLVPDECRWTEPLP